MRKRMMLAAASAVLAIALTVPASAQGRGRGFGAGMRGAGWRVGGGLGQRAGWGPGGWWTHVTPTTHEQQAFVQQVTDLHNKIRALNFEIAGLRASNAPADEITKREKEVAALRAELVRVTTANEKLIREMGIPAPYGVCTGLGPIGRPGVGAGSGWWGIRGGFGPRNGTGPNPYCPLKR